MRRRLGSFLPCILAGLLLLAAAATAASDDTSPRGVHKRRPSLHALLIRNDEGSARTLDLVAERLAKDHGFSSLVLSGYGEAGINDGSDGSPSQPDDKAAEEIQELPESGDWLYSAISELPPSWQKLVLYGMSRARSAFQSAASLARKLLNRSTVADEEEEVRALFADLAKQAVTGGANPGPMILLAEASLLGWSEEWPGSVAEMLSTTTMTFSAEVLPSESWRRGCFSAIARLAEANKKNDTAAAEASDLSITLASYTDSILLLSLGVCFAHADLEEYASLYAGPLFSFRKAIATLEETNSRVHVRQDYAGGRTSPPPYMVPLLQKLGEDLLLTREQTEAVFAKLRSHWTWEFNLIVRDDERDDDDSQEEEDEADDDELADDNKGSRSSLAAKAMRQRRIERSLQRRKEFASSAAATPSSPSSSSSSSFYTIPSSSPSLPSHQGLWALLEGFRSLEDVPAVERVSHLEKTLSFDLTVTDLSDSWNAALADAIERSRAGAAWPEGASKGGEEQQADDDGNEEAMMDISLEFFTARAAGGGLRMVPREEALMPHSNTEKPLRQEDDTVKGTTATLISPSEFSPPPDIRIIQTKMSLPRRVGEELVNAGAPATTMALQDEMFWQIIEALPSFGIVDSPEHRAVMREELMAAVLRAYESEKTDAKVGRKKEEPAADSAPLSPRPSPSPSTSHPRRLHVEYTGLTVGKAIRADLWMPGLLRLRKFYEHGVTLLSLLHLSRVRMSRQAIERALLPPSSGDYDTGRPYDAAEFFAADSGVIPLTTNSTSSELVHIPVTPSEKPFLLIFLDSFVDVLPRFVDVVMETTARVLDWVFAVLFERGQHPSPADAASAAATTTSRGGGSSLSLESPNSLHNGSFSSPELVLASQAVSSLVDESVSIFPSDEEARAVLLHLSLRLGSGYLPFPSPYSSEPVPEDPTVPPQGEGEGALSLSLSPEDEHKFLYSNHLAQLYFGMALGDKMPLTKGDTWRVLASQVARASAKLNLSADSTAFLNRLQTEAQQAEAEEEAFAKSHSLPVLLRRVAFNHPHSSEPLPDDGADDVHPDATAAEKEEAERQRQHLQAQQQHERTVVSLGRCNAAAEVLIHIAQNAIADSRISGAGNPLTSFPALWEAHEDASILSAVGEEGQNIEYLKHLADHGVEEEAEAAAFQLGELLIHGYAPANLRANLPLAMRYLERAANAGNMEARGQIGMLLLDRYLGRNLNNGGAGGGGEEEEAFDGGDAATMMMMAEGEEGAVPQAPAAAAAAAAFAVGPDGELRPVAAVEGGGDGVAGGFAGAGAFDAPPGHAGEAAAADRAPAQAPPAAADPAAVGAADGNGAPQGQPPADAPLAAAGVAAPIDNGREHPQTPPAPAPAPASTAAPSPAPSRPLGPVAGNITLAKRYLEEAANGGSAQAHAGLGFLYMVGAPMAGIRKNNSLALSHLRKAADAGYPNAHANAAVILLNGIGAPGQPLPPVMPDGSPVPLPSDEVAFNASAARWHLEQAVRQMDFLPAIFNLATIDWHGWDGDEDDEGEGEKPSEGAPKKLLSPEEIGLKRCRKALPNMMTVALRGRWAHDGSFNFKTAFELYKKAKSLEAQQHGLVARAKEWAAEILGRRRELRSPFTGPIQRSLMQYLLLSSFGVFQSADNAAFILRHYANSAKDSQSSITSLLVVASILDPVNVLLNPMNDTLPSALELKGTLLPSLLQAQERRRQKGALASFVFGGLSLPVPNAEEARQLQPQQGAPSSLSATDSLTLPLLTSSSLTLQLALRSARIGSGYGAAQIGDCYAESWPGAFECREGLSLLLAAGNASSVANQTDAAGSSAITNSSSANAVAEDWFHAAADLGHAHAVFALAEIASGSRRLTPAPGAKLEEEAAAAAVTKPNVTLAWELLYRVSYLDLFIGEVPVAAARIRVMFGWFFRSVASAASEVIAEVQRLASDVYSRGASSELSSWLDLPSRAWENLHHGAGSFAELERFFKDVWHCNEVVFEKDFVRKVSLWSPSSFGADNFHDLYSASEVLEEISALLPPDNGTAENAANSSATDSSDNGNGGNGGAEEEANGSKASKKQARKSGGRSSYSSAVRDFQLKVIRQQQLEEELNGDAAATAAAPGGGAAPAAAPGEAALAAAGAGPGADNGARQPSFFEMAKRFLLSGAGFDDEDADDGAEGVAEGDDDDAAAAGGDPSLPLHERVARTLEEDLKKRELLANELRYRLGPWPVHSHDMFLCMAAVDSFRFALFLATAVVVFGVLGAVGCGKVIVNRTVMAIRLRQAAEANQPQAPEDARQQAREELLRPGS